MGIKNLNKFLREVCPQVYKPIHISNYAYKKVAIDISIYLYKFKICFNEKWISSMINFICSLRRNKLHPVFIYDGGFLPEKMNEKKERTERKNNINKRINILQNSLHTFHTTNTIDKTLSDYSNKINAKRLISTNSINIEKIEEKLKKMTSQVNTITTHDIEMTKELCSIFNIPYLIAPLEAETTCSSLCKKGIVDLVLTDDSDVLAYSSPLYISNYNTSSGICVSITYQDMLKELNLTSEQFLDFCILCGTDYNKNIPNIGIKKAYALIKKYKSIENMENIVDTSILNYKKVRDIFLNYKECDTTYINYCGLPDFDKLQIYMKKYNIFLSVDYVKKSFISDVVLE
jgi:5'-3' exonuclease